MAVAAAVILIVAAAAAVIAVRWHQREAFAGQRPSGIPASVPAVTINLMGLSPVPASAAPGFTLTDQDGRTLPLAKPYLPELPLILPVQLQDAARQITADIQALSDGPVQRPDQELSATDRFSALEQDIVSAQAMTRGPGIPEVGDGRLWESLSAP